jgi:hypothetical protein
MSTRFCVAVDNENARLGFGNQHVGEGHANRPATDNNIVRTEFLQRSPSP